MKSYTPDTRYNPNKPVSESLKNPEVPPGHMRGRHHVVHINYSTHINYEFYEKKSYFFKIVKVPIEVYHVLDIFQSGGTVAFLF